MPLFARGTFCERLRVVHKSGRRGAHECLQVMGLERAESIRVALSSGLCFAWTTILFSVFVGSCMHTTGLAYRVSAVALIYIQTTMRAWGTTYVLYRANER